MCSRPGFILETEQIAISESIAVSVICDVLSVSRSGFMPGRLVDCRLVTSVMRN